jgi:hypothetical protein
LHTVFTVPRGAAIEPGNHLADRHEVTVTKHDGATSHMEIYLCGELADDGRLRRVDEISGLLDGGHDDRSTVNQG